MELNARPLEPLQVSLGVGYQDAKITQAGADSLAYTLLGLVVLHVAGALKHRFVDKDRANDVLSRMT
jgi:cytochrome b561